MKRVLNQDVIQNTWTEITLSSYPVAQVMIRPRSSTATMKLSYETADQDSKYITIRPGESWTDSLVHHVADKKIWISCDETGVIEIEMTVRS